MTSSHVVNNNNKMSTRRIFTCSWPMLVFLVVFRYTRASTNTNAESPYYLRYLSFTSHEDDWIPSFLLNLYDTYGLRRPRQRLKHHKSHVAYHTGENSPTFQLLNHSAIKLTLSGDINPNPGPVQNPCSVCRKAVANNHCALSCDGCGLWCHIGRKCAGITVKAYKEYQQMENLSWLCPLC